jgi:hypothetical protein
VRFPVRRQLSA